MYIFSLFFQYLKMKNPEKPCVQVFCCIWLFKKNTQFFYSFCFYKYIG